MNVNGNANLDIYFDSDRPAVRSARATVTALAAAVPLAVAFALTAPAARSVLGQAPTPQPQTTSPPTPVPTPVPGPGRTARPPGFALLGALPECNFHASLSASQDAVIAGEPVTLTVSTAIDCPQQLDRRAAVVIIGSRTHASIRDARASLTLLVEHMATGRGTRLAIVEVGAATGPAPWASTPAEIAALDGRVRQLEVQTALDETAWVDAIGAAERLLGATRPSEQPLLIVLDSWGPVSGQAHVVERMQELAGATRDRAGQVWLLDVSTTGWLAARIFRPVPVDGTVVALFPAAELNETLEHLLHQLLASAAAPITFVDVLLETHMQVGEEIPVTAPTADDATNRTARWKTPGTGHRMTLRHTASFRTTGIHSIGTTNSTVAIERTLPALRSSRRAGVFVCVDPPPPSPAICRRAAVPPTATPRAISTSDPLAETPTPTPSSAVHATGTAMATATATAIAIATRTLPPTLPPSPDPPDPTAPSATSPDAPARTLWLPIGIRDR